VSNSRSGLVVLVSNFLTTACLPTSLSDDGNGDDDDDDDDVFSKSFQTQNMNAGLNMTWN
jgi:hypothetical protein